MGSNYDKPSSRRSYLISTEGMGRKSLGGVSSSTDILGEAHLTQMDVFETPDALIVEMDIPGFDRSDISVFIREELLIIEGVKQEPRLPKDQLIYLCAERMFGHFKRTVKIQTPVDARSVSAAYSCGVLRVTLQKMPERRKEVHKISISDKE